MKKFAKIMTVALSAAVATVSTLAFASCNAKPIVGIMKFGSFGSLNNCEEGILLGLEEMGITKDKYDIQLLDDTFDTTVSASHASRLVNSGAKVIVGIATPSAMAAANAANGKVPVVYCAVTDDNNMNNLTNVCGTSDIPDYAATLELVTKVMGKEDLNIGVLSYVNESSDAAMLTSMKAEAKNYTGMVITDRMVNDTSTISTIVADMTQTVDCFVNLLDSTIVENLQTILTASTVPVFGSEVEQVVDGCIASVSYDYVQQIGRNAGRMAAQIVLGQKTAADLGKMRFSVDNATPDVYYNPDVIAKFKQTKTPEKIGSITAKSVKDYVK